MHEGDLERDTSPARTVVGGWRGQTGVLACRDGEVDHCSDVRRDLFCRRETRGQFPGSRRTRLKLSTVRRNNFAVEEAVCFQSDLSSAVVGLMWTGSGAGGLPVSSVRGATETV